MSRKDVWPLGAIGFIVAVTVAWWTLALWSVPGAPEWLERARTVCFNLTETGLPDAKGWLLLFGQPPTMLAMLLVGWGEEVRETFSRLLSVRAGRVVVVTVGILLMTGATAATAKVRDAQPPELVYGVDEPAPETYPRLDRPWPDHAGMVDQSGEAFDLSRLGGRSALVTFAFGHCRTICPAVVHQARQVRHETGKELSVVVLTLDPWRDTPSRLPALVDQFMLDPELDLVVSGGIDDVNAALDRWNVPRERDLANGDITHPGIVYLVEPDGTVAYGSTGGVMQMVSLAERLR